MTKRLNRPAPGRTETLECCQTSCPVCGGLTWQQYTNQRTLVTLEGVIRLRLKVRRCQRPSCPQYHKPYRPEAEGRFALPQHEFGLDVIAQIGAWRYREQWQRQRKAVRERFARRAQGRRFRRDPSTYLAQLEQACLKQPLLV
jgi:hypothetical protein